MHPSQAFSIYATNSAGKSRSHQPSNGPSSPEQAPDEAAEPQSDDVTEPNLRTYLAPPLQSTPDQPPLLADADPPVSPVALSDILNDLDNRLAAAQDRLAEKKRQLSAQRHSIDLFLAQLDGVAAEHRPVQRRAALKSPSNTYSSSFYSCAPIQDMHPPPFSSLHYNHATTCNSSTSTMHIAKRQPLPPSTYTVDPMFTPSPALSVLSKAVPVRPAPIMDTSPIYDDQPAFTASPSRHARFLTHRQQTSYLIHGSALSERYPDRLRNQIIATIMRLSSSTGALTFHEHAVMGSPAVTPNVNAIPVAGFQPGSSKSCRAQTVEKDFSPASIPPCTKLPEMDTNNAHKHCSTEFPATDIAVRKCSEHNVIKKTRRVSNLEEEAATMGESHTSLKRFQDKRPKSDRSSLPTTDSGLTPGKQASNVVYTANSTKQLPSRIPRPKRSKSSLLDTVERLVDSTDRATPADKSRSKLYHPARHKQKELDSRGRFRTQACPSSNPCLGANSKTTESQQANHKIYQHDTKKPPFKLF